jgi:hypothetical protein
VVERSPNAASEVRLLLGDLPGDPVLEPEPGVRPRALGVRLAEQVPDLSSSLAERQDVAVAAGLLGHVHVRPPRAVTGEGFGGAADVAEPDGKELLGPQDDRRPIDVPGELGGLPDGLLDRGLRITGAEPRREPCAQLAGGEPGVDAGHAPQERRLLPR